MKKIFFLVLLACLIFTGCSKYGNIENSDANYHIEETTGIIVGRPDEYPDKTYQWTQRNDKGNEWFEAVISGYAYTAIYDDLGIKISLNDPYTELFFTKPHKTIFVRTGNTIYNSTMSNGKIYTADTPSFFVEMFTKQTGESLFALIQSKHLSSGCIVKNYSGQNKLFFESFGIDKHHLFEITSPDGIMGDATQCLPDNEHPDIPFGIYYLQSIYHQDRYYKIAYPAACAPSCGMFTHIDFF